MKYQHLIGVSALLAAVVPPLPVIAQPHYADPAAVLAGDYKLEPNHTQIGFSVLHMGLSHYGGVYSHASGELKLDPKAPGSSSLDVSVPVDSVQTTSPVLDGELKSAKWLDAGKFPTMRFVSTRITRTGADAADVDGVLTLHGVSQPLTLKATFVGAGMNPIDKSYTVGFQAVGVVKRSGFGVKTFVPMISDDVALTINAAFHKTP